MTPLETLKAARQLISTPDSWTQEVFARDKDGLRVDAQSEEAVCFCSFGAIERFTGCKNLSEVEQHLDNVCEKYFRTNVISFNDTHTHAEVLALFDAAIAELEGVAT
jgi:hypothetical protein